jgi:hypothetical protein
LSSGITLDAINFMHAAKKAAKKPSAKKAAKKGGAKKK